MRYDFLTGHCRLEKMIVGIGIDIIEIARIAEVYIRHRERFAQRILSDAEREYVLRHSDPRHRLSYETRRFTAIELRKFRRLATFPSDSLGRR